MRFEELSTYVDPEVHTSAMQTYEAATDIKTQEHHWSVTHGAMYCAITTMRFEEQVFTFVWGLWISSVAMLSPRQCSNAIYIRPS